MSITIEGTDELINLDYVRKILKYTNGEDCNNLHIYYPEKLPSGYDDYKIIQFFSDKETMEKNYETIMSLLKKEDKIFVGQKSRVTK